MKNTVEMLEAEKRLLQNDLANIAEYQFRHGSVVTGFEDDRVIEERRQKTLRRLTWVNTELWLVRNARPSSSIR